VLKGGNLQAIEKSDFFKKSDFFAFKMVWEFPSSCTSAEGRKSSGHREIRFFQKIALPLKWSGNFPPPVVVTFFELNIR
jgi:hypothetical protein